MASSPPSALPPELTPLRADDPERIGSYRVVGRLGQGGMGAVFGALDARDRCVAVKVVHAHFAADPEFRARFAREIELMRRVGGLCTAEVHDADARAARPWVATDFVPGRTLRRHVREHGPLTGDMLTAFAAGTAESLAAIHAAGVVHCDLKPSNVILAPDGPRVLDFGIARHVASGERAGGAVFGSPGWMSPERYDGRPPTPAADVFAWGQLVALAATGRNPFGTGDPGELADRTRGGAADLDGVPEPLLGIVTDAMAGDPAARPTAEAVFGAVMAATEDTGAATPPAGIAALTERLRSRLAAHWHGIDADWHRPALWVAAASATGLATSSTVAGAGTAGAGAAAATGAGAGAGKIVAVATAVVLGAAAVTTGGYLAVDALGGGQAAPEARSTPSPSPSTPAQFVAHAADLVERADSFQAVQESQATEEEIRRNHPDADDERVRALVALGARTYTFTHSSTPEPVFQERNIGEGGGTLHQNTGGDLYVYSDTAGTWERNPTTPDGVVGPDFNDPDRYTVEAFVAPLRAAGRAPDLTDEGPVQREGRPGTRYSGTFTEEDFLSTSGTAITAGTPFDLVVGDDGYPLLLEYATRTSEHRLVFESFGEPVTVRSPDPQNTVAGACGPFTEPDGTTVVEVDSRVPGTTCAEALELARSFFAGEGTPLDSDGRIAELDGWLCSRGTDEVIDQAAAGESIGSCSEMDATAAQPPSIDFRKAG